MADRPIGCITGVTHGIGYACAESLSDKGHRVVLRDIEKDAIEVAAVEPGKDSVPIASDKARYITGEIGYVDGGRLGMHYTC